MIRIENVSFKRRNKVILKDINLNLRPGQTIALIGPNGAGKSTLLSLMARQLPLLEGDIWFDQESVLHSHSSVLARKLSLMQQSTHFMSRLRVQELLLFARYPYHKGRPRAVDHEFVDKILNYFGLQDRRNQFLDQLSGGLRQLALVAMVFSQDTDYILLDEPLNNLDMFHAKNLMGLLRKAIRDWQKSIVIVLHDVNYASQYADYIVALKHGVVAFEGCPADVLTASNLKRLYNVDAKIIEHNGKRISLHF